MLVNPFNRAVSILDGQVTVHDESAISSPAMDKLVYAAVFGEPDDREDARWLIWEIGQSVGVQPWSIHDLYKARGQGKTGGFTVPAMNIRGMVYDTARSLFRSAVKLNVGALIVEIARSEIAYTDQRPAEYVAVMLAAVGVFGTGQAWPDLAVAAGMAALAIAGGGSVVAQALKELQTGRSHITP